MARPGLPFAGVDDVVTRQLRWDGRKWPDRLHWQFEMTWLGEDEHGTWLSVPAGAAARRGEEPPRHIPHGFVSLVPRDGWWEAEFYASHPDWEVYVNIGTPCELSPERIRQVDLDLDVVRRRDGAVEVLDEDEFADHQIRYGYPPQLTDAARRATIDVVTMLEHRTEPFGNAARRWLELSHEVLGVPRPA